jgi:hypothetical protein
MAETDKSKLLIVRARLSKAVMRNHKAPFTRKKVANSCHRSHKHDYETDT